MVIVLIFIQIKSIHTTDIPAAINIHLSTPIYFTEDKCAYYSVPQVAEVQASPLHHSTPIYFTEDKCACYSLPHVAEVQASPCTLPTYHIVPGERPVMSLDVVRSIRWQNVNSAC